MELYGDVSLTNGIGFSPDGARLYHSDTKEPVWRAGDAVQVQVLGRDDASDRWELELLPG